MTEETGKIISFERPADFYYRSAMEMANRERYLKALPMMRRAVEKDAGNDEYKIRLAELLTDLSKYEESNCLIFEMLREDGIRRSDCYFSMGCNFLGLNEYEKAQESFLKYLSMDPDGDLSDAAEDFLSYFFDEEDCCEDDWEDTPEKQDAQKGKEYLDGCEYEKAIRIFEKINPDDDELVYVQNNLALAYYCMKKVDKAIEITKKVLERLPENVHANCNMSIFLYSQNDPSYYAYIETAEKQKDVNYEELYKLAVTYCEIGEHAQAIERLKDVLRHSPYDEKLLFCAAIANYNTGNYRCALNYLLDVLTLDPHDSIAAYYVGYIKSVMEGSKEFEELHYIFQVPGKEIKERIQYLNQTMRLPAEECTELWQNDKRLSDVLLWGLVYGDTVIKKAVTKVIGNFGDKKSEKIFRRYLLRRNQPDEIKSEIFIELKKMKAIEPYVAYFNGNIVEVRVGLPNDKMWGAHRMLGAFSTLANESSNDFSADTIEKAGVLLKRFIETGEAADLLYYRKELAGAALFVALCLHRELMQPQAIADMFDADLQKMTEIIAQIIETLHLMKN